MKVYIALLFVTQFAFSQAQKNTAFQNPYEQLSYLIGSWEHNFGRGMAYMTFAWGPNKTYITVVNENSIQGERKQENYSLIIWDGVQEKFVVNTSFTDPGSLLYGHGTITVKDGLFKRDMAVNYAEGQYMPFLKRRAGQGGFTMPYRQRWRIIDANCFEGIFEVFIDGKYTDPFGRPKEQWTRIKQNPK